MAQHCRCVCICANVSTLSHTHTRARDKTMYTLTIRRMCFELTVWHFFSSSVIGEIWITDTYIGGSISTSNRFFFSLKEKVYLKKLDSNRSVLIYLFFKWIILLTEIYNYNFKLVHYCIVYITRKWFSILHNKLYSICICIMRNLKWFVFSFRIICFHNIGFNRHFQ